MVPRNYPFKIKRIPTNKRPGEIIKNEAHYRHAHEMRTAKRLAKFGHDIVLIKPSNIPHLHTADCYWRGKYWEMKSPTKNRGECIVNAIKEGTNQSRQIIIDIARNKRDIKQAAGDIVGYIMKHKQTKIERVFLLDGERYCEILKGVIVL